jgi:hypothetical protein
MQKKLVVVALSAALAVPALVLAQAKADLAGTWTFDEAKSDPAPAPPGGGGRGGGGGGGGGRMGGGTPTKLVITQTGAELTVESTLANGAQTAAYKLDGSESVNKMGMGEAISVSVCAAVSVVSVTMKVPPLVSSDLPVPARRRGRDRTRAIIWPWPPPLPWQTGLVPCRRRSLQGRPPDGRS